LRGWRLVEHLDGHFTGVDTAVPNRMLKAALEAREVPALADYTGVRAEVKYGEKSRIDFLLSAEGKPDAYVEVKSVTLCSAPTQARCASPRISTRVTSVPFLPPMAQASR